MTSTHDPAHKPQPPVREPGAVAIAVHVVLAVAVWAGFGWLWGSVFLRTPPAEGVRGTASVFGVLAVCAGATVAWIRHNRLLYRRLGERRRESREAPRDWSRDAVGRPVRGPSWERLREAPEVEVDVDPATGEKVYRGF